MEKGRLGLSKPPRGFRASFPITDKSMLLSITLVLLATVFISNQWRQTGHQHIATSLGPISYSDFEYGLKQCKLNHQRPVTNYDLAEDRLRLRSQAAKRTVLVNATLVNGDGQITPGCDIEMQDGIFLSVCTASLWPSNAEVIDLGGRIVTPGLMDMHSHAGVRETPQLWSTEDVTEVSSQVTPWGRAIDGLKPQDQAIPVIGSGGVTTSLVLTGAKNLISGEGVVIKMRRGDSVKDLLVDVTGNGTKPLRYLKMAVGENQKRQFENTPGGPTTRYGEAYWIRRAYENARQVKWHQDRWCEAALDPKKRVAITEEYPHSLEWQTLVDVLRGDVRVNVHGYDTEDVIALLDHADEFGFNITALHHALHSDQVTGQIKERGIAVVGFSDSWGDKKELYNVSSYLPQRMADHGIPFALTRDHPAEHGQWLLYEAQIAHHFGLNTTLALASIISEPARILGLDNKLGHVRPGYDADLVVWDRHPLRVGAAPLQVFIDGKSTVRAPEKIWNLSVNPAYKKEPTLPRPNLEVENACSPGQKDVVITGLKKAFVGDNGRRAEELAAVNLTAIIRDGVVICVGTSKCDSLARQAASEDVPFVEVSDGYMIPGLTVLTRQHGLAEMRQELSTVDGYSVGDDFAKPIASKFGIKFDGIHINRARRGGISRIVTPPLTHGFFHGISTVFRSGAKSVIDSSAIIKEDVALHFTIGHNGKTPKTPSVTSQISTLRDLLTTEKHIHSVYERAANGDLPVVIHTNNKDVIAHMIALKKETGAHIVISGGAEAHLLASELYEAQMPVIMAPFWGCEPLFWESRNCLPGPPLVEAFGPQVLLNHGVKVAISNWDDTNNHIRNSPWEAGWIARPDNDSLALDLVSKNIEDILRLPRTTDIAIYEGNPFEFGARLAMIFEEGEVQECYPPVDEEP